MVMQGPNLANRLESVALLMQVMPIHTLETIKRKCRRSTKPFKGLIHLLLVLKSRVITLILKRQ